MMLNVGFYSVNIGRYLCFRREKQENLNAEPVQNVALRVLSPSVEVKQTQSRNADSPYQDFKMQVYLDYGAVVYNAAFTSSVTGPF